MEKDSEGLEVKKIKNSYTLRLTECGDIYMHDVFVPDHNKLPKGEDFASSVNVIFEFSRVGVSWMITSVAAGAYEAAIKHAVKRKQFGKSIAGFQATQLKLSRMAG